MDENDRIAHVQHYVSEVIKQLQTGHATEHSYRPALKELINALGENIEAINEPKQSEHGAPDFVMIGKKNKDIKLAYGEAKIPGENLDKIEKSEQMDRYKGYANLFLTDCLDWRFYRNGEKIIEIKIGEFNREKTDIAKLFTSEYIRLAEEIASFLDQTPEKIRSGKRLAQIMGGKSRRIRDNVKAYIHKSDEQSVELTKMYDMMKKMLVHDLSEDKFADMYAQTLVYGLFVARYGDSTSEDFSRSEARDLVPASNPFLRHFFDHIVGPSFDKRLGYIVDELCEVFAVSNVQDIVHKHLRIQDETSDAKDPIIHFYEDFLQEYDAAERKRMGAYYTPIPVVKYIVRQVDRILREDFGLANGLASAEEIDHWFETGQEYKERKNAKNTVTGYYKKIPRVQILDPAVGTATFLNETIKFIHKEFEGQEGRWPSYVNDNLLKRLHGFELMMAPYTIAHLKLGMTLKETGVDKLNERLGVYLTNTLEEGIPAQTDIFSFGLAEAVSEESRLAAEIKNERPIMVMMGNPPYSGVSSNETQYANSLIGKYKVEPGGRQKLQERKHWLNDDYVKFIAFAEDMIVKQGSGVVAMITNNGYLDNPTFRGMRWHLAKTFDKIYVLDLHGNAKKKEVAPDGGKDENVFDIMQGVSIVLAVKGGNYASELAEVFHADIYGKRKVKFAQLDSDVEFNQISYDNNNVYFVPKNTHGQEEYEQGVALDKLFLQNVTGIVTMGDSFIVADSPHTIAERVQRLARREYSEQQLNSEFGLGKNYAKYVLENVPKLVFDESKIVRLNYRPFDERYTYFDNKVIWRWREKVMRHFLSHDNEGIIAARQCVGDWQYVFATDKIGEFNITGTAGRFGSGNYFPLYLYHEDGTRTPNFAPAELSALTRQLTGEPSPEDILDYIYAVLHSPSYREKYKEFLKIDFPRVPAPTQAEFDRLVPLGRELRELHLMKSPSINDYPTTYPIAGDDTVDKLQYSEEKVWINDTQYFGNVPEIAWNFYIGGYQPAQKWLKDRKGRKLSGADLDHYQKIIKILLETARLMKQIG
jgi:predicted helicase